MDSVELVCSCLFSMSRRFYEMEMPATHLACIIHMDFRSPIPFKLQLLNPMFSCPTEILFNTFQEINDDLAFGSIGKAMSSDK